MSCANSKCLSGNIRNVPPFSLDTPTIWQSAWRTGLAGSAGLRQAQAAACVKLLADCWNVRLSAKATFQTMSCDNWHSYGRLYVDR